MIIIREPRLHSGRKDTIMEDENVSLSGSQEESVVSSQQGDDAAAGAEGAKSSASAGQNRQTHEENARYQAARHQGDRAGYDRARAELNQRIAAMGMRNAQSGTVISTIEDLEAYGKSVRRTQLEAKAKQTGRTVDELEEEEDNKAFVTRQRQKEEKERTEKAEEEKRKAWIADDAAKFAADFPDVDILSLDGNKAFRRFCGSRYGREPLSDLYADYMEITGGAAAAASAKAQSKSARATGSGSGSGAETLTAEQQRSLDEWNRAYPQLKMTAKEFLSREE